MWFVVLIVQCIIVSSCLYFTHTADVWYSVLTEKSFSFKKLIMHCIDSYLPLHGDAWIWFWYVSGVVLSWLDNSTWKQLATCWLLVGCELKMWVFITLADYHDACSMLFLVWILLCSAVWWWGGEVNSWMDNWTVLIIVMIWWCNANWWLLQWMFVTKK